MRIENLSTTKLTVAIFIVMGLSAIILSLWAGSFFRQSALNAQMNSLSRVIEVASDEMLEELKQHAYDFSVKLGHDRKLIEKIKESTLSDEKLIELLDDPFINGFVGFSQIDLVKLRVYDLNLNLIGESSAGIKNLQPSMPEHLHNSIKARNKSDRLKAIEALWLSSKMPLFSTIVPLGGLHPVGYLEVIIDPAFNLPEISRITHTPISIYNMSGTLIDSVNQAHTEDNLPVEYIIQTTDGLPAFRIVGLEDVTKLNEAMHRTQVLIVSGFLLLAIIILLLALWLMNRFMLKPLRNMASDMHLFATGKLKRPVSVKGLAEFHKLFNAFSAMASQIRMRTKELEKLLDLDDSAIICFDSDHEIVFFNKAALKHFGYSFDEFADNDMVDLFVSDIPSLMRKMNKEDIVSDQKRYLPLVCRHKEGHEFQSDSVINSLEVMGQPGYAIALHPATDDDTKLSVQSKQRLEIVEQSLASLLAFAKENPSLVLNTQPMGHEYAREIQSDKTHLRSQAVNLMNQALLCWEREIGKSKLDLAEESKIWPVYIDKSTPTTRTLDKYLNLETCPKNPRATRVLNTVTFVLDQIRNDKNEHCRELESELDKYRQLLSGTGTK